MACDSQRGALHVTRSSFWFNQLFEHLKNPQNRLATEAGSEILAVSGLVRASTSEE
jgi:hypothetical protein